LDDEDTDVGEKCLVTIYGIIELPVSHDSKQADDRVRATPSSRIIPIVYHFSNIQQLYTQLPDPSLAVVDALAQNQFYDIA
jgi:hypothetical protein